jgi:recombination protein RecT
MPAPTADKTGQIVPRSEAQSNADKMALIVQKMTPDLARALPKHMTGERMARIVTTAIRMNPKLGDCTPTSFVGCILSCAVLGLEPNTPLGHAFLIPRMNNKIKQLECTMQLGYMGMIELGGRAGTTLYAYAVRDGDEFHYHLGMQPDIHHVPSEAEDRETKPITHAYCVAVLPDGRRSFTVLNRVQIEARRQRSPSAADGPWITDYEAMCLKTVVRAHFKWIPKQTEKDVALARGIAIEDATENGAPLLSALDPMLTDAMAKQGLDVTGETVEPAAGNGN